MISLEFNNIEELKKTHFEAVKSYICHIIKEEDRKTFYQAVVSLPGMEEFLKGYQRWEENFEWLKRFILADLNTLASWVANKADMLQFNQMKKLYSNRFSNGAGKYVDKENTYNAFTLFKMMDLAVCPYCEHEFLEVVEVNSVNRRTMEFDHFYPKSSYPALAMCFYNLIPSCQSCNNLKMANLIGANPYDVDIEKQTSLRPDLPLGINMSTVKDEDCQIKLHAIKGMIQNNAIFSLEQRYKKLSNEAYRLLKKSQDYPEEKLREIADLIGKSTEEFRCEVFGRPRCEAKGKELHTKMKWDLIGF